MTFFIFFKQELLSATKNFGHLLHNILFFVISCSVFFLIVQNQGQSQSFHTSGAVLAPGIIWMILLFSQLFANGNFLVEENRDGTLEQMIIFCPNLEIYIAAKMLASWVLFVLPILIIIPLVMFLVGQNQDFILRFTELTALASVAINFICAFCGSLNIAKNKAPLLAILALPLIIPILLIASTAFNGELCIDEEFYKALKILAAISIFVGTILTVATTKVVKILNE